jgi:hypothetical protein
MVAKELMAEDFRKKGMAGNFAVNLPRDLKKKAPLIFTIANCAACAKMKKTLTSVTKNYFTMQFNNEQDHALRKEMRIYETPTAAFIMPNGDVRFVVPHFLEFTPEDAVGVARIDRQFWLDQLA